MGVRFKRLDVAFFHIINWKKAPFYLLSRQQHFNVSTKVPKWSSRESYLLTFLSHFYFWLHFMQYFILWLYCFLKTQNLSQKVFLYNKIFMFLQVVFIKCEQLTDRSSRLEVFCKKGVLGNFTKFTGKHRLRPAALLKKRLWRRCFLVSFAKFLRKIFYRTTPGDCFCTFQRNFWGHL